MEFAILNGGKAQAAHTGQRAVCPGCGSEVLSKCGVHVVKHWAHRSADCDPWSEPESEWHRFWKSAAAPAERQEVVMGPHRADAVLANGVVVEIQRSPLSEADIAEREEFYTANAAGLVWVVNHEWLRRRAFSAMRCPVIVADVSTFKRLELSEDWYLAKDLPDLASKYHADVVAHAAARADADAAWAAKLVALRATRDALSAKAAADASGLRERRNKRITRMNELRKQIWPAVVLGCERVEHDGMVWDWCVLRKPDDKGFVEARRTIEFLWLKSLVTRKGQSALPSWIRDIAFKNIDRVLDGPASDAQLAIMWQAAEAAGIVAECRRYVKTHPHVIDAASEVVLDWPVCFPWAVSLVPACPPPLPTHPPDEEPMRPPIPTHAARAADARRVTLCMRTIDDVALAPWGTWPTCTACVAAIETSEQHKRALGLAGRLDQNA